LVPVTPLGKASPASAPVPPMEKVSIACIDIGPCNTLDVSSPLSNPPAVSPDAGLARPNLEVVRFLARIAVIPGFYTKTKYSSYA
jgi:hypothetical protein